MSIQPTSKIPESLLTEYKAKFVGNNTYELPQTFQLLFYNRLLKLPIGKQILAYRLGNDNLGYKYYVEIRG